MERIVTYENLRFFAYSNDKIINGEIKGIVIDFFGLGSMAMYSEDTKAGKLFAEKNILFITPYTNPWGWMNLDEVRFSDEIIQALKEKYKLDNSTPLVSIGGSMGGLASIVYTAYSIHKPIGCVANCPVCDLPYHYTERVDLPRTLYSAFYSYEGSLDSALRSSSPLHLIDKLPKSTKYTIFHCEKDSAVNIDMHSTRFVNEMRKTREIDYITIPNKDHCDLGEDMYKKYLDTAINYILDFLTSRL